MEDEKKKRTSPKMHDVDLGFAKFKVTRQAIIIFTFTLFMWLIAMLTTIYRLQNTPLAGSPALIGTTIISMIFAIGYAILVGYIFNCVVVGKCIVLSWVFVGIYSFGAFLYILMAIGLYTAKSFPRPETMKSLKRSFSPRK